MRLTSALLLPTIVLASCTGSSTRSDPPAPKLGRVLSNSGGAGGIVVSIGFQRRREVWRGIPCREERHAGLQHHHPPSRGHSIRGHGIRAIREWEHSYRRHGHRPPSKPRRMRPARPFVKRAAAGTRKAECRWPTASFPPNSPSPGSAQRHSLRVHCPNAGDSKSPARNGLVGSSPTSGTNISGGKRRLLGRSCPFAAGMPPTRCAPPRTPPDPAACSRRGPGRGPISPGTPDGTMRQDHQPQGPCVGVPFHREQEVCESCVRCVLCVQTASAWAPPMDGDMSA